MRFCIRQKKNSNDENLIGLKWRHADADFGPFYLCSFYTSFWGLSNCNSVGCKIDQREFVVELLRHAAYQSVLEIFLVVEELGHLPDGDTRPNPKNCCCKSAWWKTSLEQERKVCENRTEGSSFITGGLINAPDIEKREELTLRVDAINQSSPTNHEILQGAMELKV